MGKKSDAGALEIGKKVLSAILVSEEWGEKGSQIWAAFTFTI